MFSPNITSMEGGFTVRLLARGYFNTQCSGTLMGRKHNSTWSHSDVLLQSVSSGFVTFVARHISRADAMPVPFGIAE